MVYPYVEDPSPQRPEEVPEFLTRELPRVASFSQEVVEEFEARPVRVVACGQTEVDFGATPSSETSVVVTGVSAVTSSSRISVWIQEATTTDNDASAHQFAAISMRVVAGTIVAGVGFTLSAFVLLGEASGKFKLTWMVMEVVS